MSDKKIGGLLDFREFYLMIDKQLVRIYEANRGRDIEILDAVSVLRYELERSRKELVSELDCIERSIVALLQELHPRVSKDLFEEITKAAGVRIGSKPGDQGGH